MAAPEQNQTGRTVSFDEFISGGYYLVSPAERADWMSALLPSSFPTVCPCLAEVAPLWSWEQPTDPSEPEPGDGLWLLLLQAGARVPGTFNIALGPSTSLLGIGLHESLEPLMHEQRDQDVTNGYDLLERMAQQKRLAPGKALAFEPLCFRGMSFCSWIGNSLPDGVRTELHIRPAANGLIADFVDACQVTGYIRRSNREPGIWLPWLLVQYL